MIKTLTKGQIEVNKHYISLFESKYGFKFLQGPSFKEVPFVSRKYSDEYLCETIGEIEDFLLDTYIIDMGTNDHDEQQKIKKEMHRDEYLWHKRHNKLGKNNSGSKISKVVIMGLNIALNRTDLKVPEEIHQIATRYSPLSLEQKIEYVHKVDKEAYALLEKLNK